ncbi:MAG: caspase family protein [Acidimicrobiales bacterium]
MTKKALCVGINDYPIAGMDLNGCVNDARAWSSVLRKQYDFASADVRVLLDKAATHRKVIDGLKALLAGARSGDVLVFTNSSHGTYLADRGSDEADRYDEAMCPYDCKTSLLTDDQLRNLFADIPRGVRLTVISDSCHSGSVTRAVVGRATPDDRRVRFLNPRKLRQTEIKDVRTKATPRRIEVHPESEMKELLLSGCRSNQYSYDARFGSRYQGAMTWYALQVIKDAGYRLTYSALATRLRDALAVSNYDQEPQLEGKVSFKRRQIFT